ncbi:MAG: M3 family oligoendopeptidase [Planctomycetes bacterium]|nr:M3 family oligoendopeptidase [Planctomycetota bacterium]
MDPTRARLADLRLPAPDLTEVTALVEGVLDDLRAADAARRTAAVRRWDAQRRRNATWASLAQIRFRQDTGDAAARAEREIADALVPKLDGLDARVQRAILEGPHREAFARELGDHVLDLWAHPAAVNRPEVEDDLARENALAAEYTRLMGSARLAFDGRTHTLASIRGFASHADRALRERAERVRWGYLAEHASELDGLFDELVALRAGIARKLGAADFVEVGYHRMKRTGYGRSEVETFRAQVREHVVPLGAEIVRRQAERLGIPKVMLWDEKVHETGEPPVPQQDAEALSDAADGMFADLSDPLTSLFRTMRARGLLDLESRDGKGMGGFCSFLPEVGAPFVFANFDGTRGDVRVFTHEMGHALQGFLSRENFPYDVTRCPSESAEVHSMSLEFLTWPLMERFFDGRADDFRRSHLVEQILFLPYGCAVDHFQHMVYERPEAGASERHAMWSEVSALYLPWRDAGDLPHASTGGFWQSQLHVYQYPFYYVDYVLAATCALQFWARSLDDHEGALSDYHALCARGGTLPFERLVESAGLRSPLREGCLADVVDAAARWLG